MKRIAIVLSVILIVFTLITACGNRDTSIGEFASGTVSSEAGCVEHSSEAAYSQWSECTICEAMSGKQFTSQCETWEDIVARSGFDKYSYELTVEETDSIVMLSLTFEDAEIFSDDEWGVHYFMRDSYLAFVGISSFTQNRSSVDVPIEFQKFVIIKLDFPGGTVVCTTNDYTPLGISTSLYVDEESPYKFKIERVYNLFFKSVD